MLSLRETMLCVLAAAALAAAGCTERGLSTDPSLVRFTSSARDFETRATDVTLSDDDVVGIFATDPIAAGNVRAVVSGKSIFPDRNMYWAEGQKVATRFSAYCPYVPETSGETFPFSVADDQRDYAGYAASDLRTASVTVAPEHIVNFIFEHRLSKILLDIDPDGRTVSDVSLKSVLCSGTVNMVTGAVSDLGSRGDVHAGLAAASAEARVYVAVFMPQTEQLGLVVTADGKRFIFLLEQPQEFLPGCAYYASLKLEEATPEEPSVGFSVSITDWESGEPLEFSREQ